MLVGRRSSWITRDLGWLPSTHGLCYLLLIAVLVADVVLGWRLFEDSEWGARWYMWRRNRRAARQRRRR